MTSKLRIKIGSLEIEYEGSDEFIKVELPMLLDKLYELKGSSEVEESDDDETQDGNGKAPGLDMTTNTIAQKLGAKSGSDLTKSAAARLGLILGKETFSRKEILKEMGSAKSFFKKSYRNNLDNSLKTLLTNNVLLLQGENIYALHDTAAKDLKAKLV